MSHPRNKRAGKACIIVFVFAVLVSTLGYLIFLCGSQEEAEHQASHSQPSAETGDINVLTGDINVLGGDDKKENGAASERGDVNPQDAKKKGVGIIPHSFRMSHRLWEKLRFGPPGYKKDKLDNTWNVWEPAKGKFHAWIEDKVDETCKKFLKSTKNPTTEGYFPAVKGDAIGKNHKEHHMEFVHLIGRYGRFMEVRIKGIRAHPYIMFFRLDDLAGYDFKTGHKQRHKKPEDPTNASGHHEEGEKTRSSEDMEGNDQQAGNTNSDAQDGSEDAKTSSAASEPEPENRIAEATCAGSDPMRPGPEPEEDNGHAGANPKAARAEEVEGAQPKPKHAAEYRINGYRTGPWAKKKEVLIPNCFPLSADLWNRLYLSEQHVWKYKDFKHHMWKVWDSKRPERFWHHKVHPKMRPDHEPTAHVRGHQTHTFHGGLRNKTFVEVAVEVLPVDSPLIMFFWLDDLVRYDFSSQSMKACVERVAPTVSPLHMKSKKSQSFMVVKESCFTLYEEEK